MDEWGTSVWDTPSDAVSPKPQVRLVQPPFIDASESASFDGDAFGEAAQPTGDDDFGDDFGDFDEGQNTGFDDGDMIAFRETELIPERLTLPLRAMWEPLRLVPLPSLIELSEQVQEILEPIWPLPNSEEIMTGEDIRQVEGLSQILVSPESRKLYQTLFNVSPSSVVRPPNWTRSRIRRQHLISLGIPINLDEVMPHINGKPLPALNVTTRPSSAPPGPRPVVHSNPPSGSNTRAGTPRPGTPQSSSKIGHSPLGLGPKPKLNDTKIAEMLDLSSDTLPLLPLPTLESHLSTLRALTSETSTLLSYLLQIRESLQQDSETYNGLIAELVGEAQKMKTGSKVRGGVGRRGSGI